MVYSLENIEKNFFQPELSGIPVLTDKSDFHFCAERGVSCLPGKITKFCLYSLLCKRWDTLGILKKLIPFLFRPFHNLLIFKSKKIGGITIDNSVCDIFISPGHTPFINSEFLSALMTCYQVFLINFGLRRFLKETIPDFPEGFRTGKQDQIQIGS